MPAGERSGELFSYVDLEARVRRDHTLRAIRKLVNAALAALEADFAALYAPLGSAGRCLPEPCRRARRAGAASLALHSMF
jgi:hypothetical protein